MTAASEEDVRDVFHRLGLPDEMADNAFAQTDESQHGDINALLVSIGQPSRGADLDAMLDDIHSAQ